MSDILNRVNLLSSYHDKEKKDAIEQAKYNIKHIPNDLLKRWDLLNNTDFLNNITDNDLMIITNLGSQLIMNDKITELYMADNWEILADNFIFIDQTANNKPIKTIDIKTLYNTDETWNKNVKSAQSVMSKAPPPKFIEKWPLLGSEDFRNRMRSTDRNAAITLTLSMTLAKNQLIKCIFQTEDWELLKEMLKII